MKYSQELKDQVIEEIKEVKSISTVAKKHDIPSSTIHGWLKSSDTKVLLKSEVKNKDLKVENIGLKKKLADAELELMILKDLLKKSYNP